MQKIIDNNARMSTKPQYPQEFNPHKGGSFFFDIQEFTQNMYVFKAKDYEHALTCEMTLELKEQSFYVKGKKSEEILPILACKFPSIDVHEFNKKVCWEEYLQGILMIQFHLKILEQLLNQKDTILIDDQSPSPHGFQTEQANKLSTQEISNSIDPVLDDIHG